MQIQLTFEYRRFEESGSTYRWIFFNTKYYSVAGWVEAAKKLDTKVTISHMRINSHVSQGSNVSSDLFYLKYTD